MRYIIIQTIVLSIAAAIFVFGEIRQNKLLQKSGYRAGNDKMCNVYSIVCFLIVCIFGLDVFAYIFQLGYLGMSN